VLVLRQNIHGFDQEAMVVSTKKQIRLNIREFVLANPILFKRAEEPLTLPESSKVESIEESRRKRSRNCDELDGHDEIIEDSKKPAHFRIPFLLTDCVVA